MFYRHRTLLWIALLLLNGCAAQSSGVAHGDVSNVAVGMTKSEVISILGQPKKQERYGPTEFLFYSNTYGEGFPIAIVDDKVTSVGHGAYDIVAKSKTQTDRTGATR